MVVPFWGDGSTDGGGHGGGLRLIPAHVFVDCIACLGLTYCCVVRTRATKDGSSNIIGSKSNHNDANTIQILLGIGIMVVAVSGNFTNKWTMIFPLLPLMILQIIRHVFSFVKHHKILSIVILILSGLLIVLAAALSIFLFPAVQLPLPVIDHTPTMDTNISITTRRYQVGMVETFLPVSNLIFDHDYIEGANYTRPGGGKQDRQHIQDHVTVRILYPTVDTPKAKLSRTKFLRDETAVEFCRSTMKFGAPPPLKAYDWMVHYWRLMTLPNVHRNAKVYTEGKEDDDKKKKWPVIVYSHGLGGTAEMYTYQTVALASAGYIVLVVEHLDGSGAVVRKQDGTLLPRDETVVQDWFEKRYLQYAKKRRIMVHHRAQELLAAVDAFLSLNTNNRIPEIEDAGVDFTDSINTDEIHYMGHSFGGSSVLHAAKLRPNSGGTVIAHEPVSDWLPDESRHDLFSKDRLQGGPYYESYDGGTGGFGSTANTGKEDDNSSLHDIEMLILWSYEWFSKQNEGSHILMDMYERGEFGPKGEPGSDSTNGTSHIGVIDQALHNEFSDTCMITPLWIARASKITGERNPLHTAYEIHQRTLKFLKEWEKKKESDKKSM